jgi:hypothetical protein
LTLRTVRLEPETERALAEIQRETGLSASAAIRRGVVALRERLRERGSASPWEIYAKLELGPGGHARAPARKAKQALRATLGRKHRR